MRKHMNDIMKATAIAWYQEHVKQGEIVNREILRVLICLANEAY